MCSSSPAKKGDEKTSPTQATASSQASSGSSCFRGAARALVKKLKKNKAVQSSSEFSSHLEVIGGRKTNNENLPPSDTLKGIVKKKYTVNKKRSAQESFDRLRKHVPTLEGKDDVSQLDVLLEAIQYIQSLRKDLGKEDMEDNLQLLQAQHHQLSLLTRGNL